MRDDPCTWCGTSVPPGDGFRAYVPSGERRAAFCRLEHVVPWAIRGAHWEPGVPGEADAVDEVMTSCAWCGDTLSEGHVLLIRARGDHRVPDGFCSVEHLLEWAKAGGRWASPR